jgi:LysM repeat protein
MRDASLINQSARVAMPSSSTTSSKATREQRLSRMISLIALIIIIPLAAISLLVILFQANELVLPEVYILDKEVGMMKRQDAATWVDQFWNQERKIQLVVAGYPDIVYALKPMQLGLWVDPEATANAAYNVGRSADPFKDVGEAIKGDPQVVLPIIFYDQNTAQNTLASIAEDLHIPPTNANIIYQDGQWIALPGSEGQALDLVTIQKYLVDNAFDILQKQHATLPLRALSPEVEDLSPILGEIEAIIQEEFILEAYDPITDERFTWSVPMDIKREWVQYDPTNYQIKLVFNHDQVEELVITWASDLGEERGLLDGDQVGHLIEKWQGHETLQTIVHYEPTAYTVQSGESLWGISLKLGMPMWHILGANEGLTADNVTAGMTLTIPPKDILLPLPVVRNKRIVIDISEQKMTVYENGEIRNTHVVSTGMDDSPTMAGIFQVQSHELNAYASNWDLYMPHFMGIYEAWPGFMNGIHGLPLLSNGQRLWASNLGSPASYGCIILTLSAAEDLYYWADDGVIVEIRR